MDIRALVEKIDIASVETQARVNWAKRQRAQRRVEEWLVRLLPFGLVVMVIAFYLLSSPHTGSILDLITPGMGWAAPVGFELGILITAALRERGIKNPLTLGLLITLIAMSIMINIAGGFMSILAMGGQELTGKTIDELLGGFSQLSAVYQVALFIVAPIGAAIPFVAALAGEVLIKLASGRVGFERETDDQKWARAAGAVMYNALLQEALKSGVGTKTAGNWAQTVVDQLYRYRPAEIQPQPAPLSGISRTNGQPDGRTDNRTSGQHAPIPARAHAEPAKPPMGFVSAFQRTDNRTDGQPDNAADKGHGYGRDYTRTADARTRVLNHLADNPADVNLTVRALADKVGVGKTVAAEARREFLSN